MIFYWLNHIRINYGYEDHTDEKTCGFFSTRENVQAAIQKLIQQPGFRDYPDGFEITELTLDKIEWAEGFTPPPEIQSAGDEDDGGTTRRES